MAAQLAGGDWPVLSTPSSSGLPGASRHFPGGRAQSDSRSQGGARLAGYTDFYAHLLTSDSWEQGGLPPPHSGGRGGSDTTEPVPEALRLPMMCWGGPRPASPSLLRPPLSSCQQPGAHRLPPGCPRGVQGPFPPPFPSWPTGSFSSYRISAARGQVHRCQW